MRRLETDSSLDLVWSAYAHAQSACFEQVMEPFQRHAEQGEKYAFIAEALAYAVFPWLHNYRLKVHS